MKTVREFRNRNYPWIKFRQAPQGNILSCQCDRCGGRIAERHCDSIAFILAHCECREA